MRSSEVRRRRNGLIVAGLVVMLIAMPASWMWVRVVDTQVNIWRSMPAWACITALRYGTVATSDKAAVALRQRLEKQTLSQGAQRSTFYALKAIHANPNAPWSVKQSELSAYILSGFYQEGERRAFSDEETAELWHEYGVAKFKRPKELMWKSRSVVEAGGELLVRCDWSPLSDPGLMVLNPVRSVVTVDGPTVEARSPEQARYFSSSGSDGQWERHWGQIGGADWQRWVRIPENLTPGEHTLKVGIYRQYAPMSYEGSGPGAVYVNNRIAEGREFVHTYESRFVVVKPGENEPVAVANEAARAAVVACISADVEPMTHRWEIRVRAKGTPVAVAFDVYGGSSDGPKVLIGRMACNANESIYRTFYANRVDIGDGPIGLELRPSAVAAKETVDVTSYWAGTIELPNVKVLSAEDKWPVPITTARPAAVKR